MEMETRGMRDVPFFPYLYFNLGEIGGQLQVGAESPTGNRGGNMYRNFDGNAAIALGHVVVVVGRRPCGDLLAGDIFDLMGHKYYSHLTV